MLIQKLAIQNCSLPKGILEKVSWGKLWLERKKEQNAIKSFFGSVGREKRPEM